MLCSGCGVEVSERQKFCHECGTSVPHDADAIDVHADSRGDEAEARGLLPTQPVAVVDGLAPDATASGVDEPSIETPTDDLPTESFEMPIDDLPPTESVEISTDDLPMTQPIEISTDDLPMTQPIEISTDDLPMTEPIDTPTEVIEIGPGEGEAAGTWVDAAPTTPLAIVDPWTTDQQSTAPVTEEMPAIFDGDHDLAEYPPASEPFKIRLVFVLALFGAAAVLMAMVANVIDLRTTRPAPGIATGVQTLEQLGTNLGFAGFVGAAVMVVGGLLACFGLRWGAGLAGGAGLSLTGWAALSIGLAELPIAVAESITRTSSELFTLRVTRDLGWWLIAGVGIVGLIVFFLSLRSIGSGGRPALNPLIAALTAVAAVVLAFGPLVPDNASFADNFRSTDPTRDLPTAFFAGRLTQVALIMLAGVIGMLIVRSWGVGLAVGSLSVPVWLWVSSLGEIGSAPVGIAYRNPGADTTVPNAVTTVGMVATLVMLAVASAFATYRLMRSRPAA